MDWFGIGAVDKIMDSCGQIMLLSLLLCFYIQNNGLMRSDNAVELVIV